MRLLSFAVAASLLLVPALAHADREVPAQAPRDVRVEGPGGMSLFTVVRYRTIQVERCKYDEKGIQQTCRHDSYEEPIWEKVCPLPCSQPLASNRLYSVSEGAHLPSRAFSLPEGGGPVTLRVKGVSKQDFAQGFGLTLSGSLLMTGGGLFLLAGLAGKDISENTEGFTGTEKRNFTIAGTALAALGTGLLVYGIVYLATHGSMTHVQTREGINVAKRTAPRLTPTGLAF